MDAGSSTSAYASRASSASPSRSTATPCCPTNSRRRRSCTGRFVGTCDAAPRGVGDRAHARQLHRLRRAGEEAGIVEVDPLAVLGDVAEESLALLAERQPALAQPGQAGAQPLDDSGSPLEVMHRHVAELELAATPVAL